MQRVLHPETPVARRASALGHAGFDYTASPELFLGQEGEGPLRLVLDTNVVIELTQRFDDVVGALGWAGLQPQHWETRDGALRDLFAIWFWRDVRIHISDLTLDDAKRTLSAHRQARRLQALEMFARDRAFRDPSRPAPAAEVDLPELADLPAGRDGELVRDAVSLGAHAFVTLDHGIHRYADALTSWRLRICDPEWLLETLVIAGEFSLLAIEELPPVADLLMLGKLYALAEDDDPPAPPGSPPQDPEPPATAHAH